MIAVSTMPWHLVIGDNQLDCVLYSVADGAYKCEFPEDECNPLPFCLGTSDSREPKFCFKHYFIGIDGDGITNYKIVPHFN